MLCGSKAHSRNLAVPTTVKTMSQEDTMQRLFLSMGAVTTLLAAFHFLTSGSCGAEKDKPAASEGKTLDQQLAAYQK